MTGWGTSNRSVVVAGALALAGWLLGFQDAAQAHGYPGAQAEAQGDAGSDPYNFPNIKLCCERRRWKGPNGGPVKNPVPPGPQTVSVNCGMPTDAPRSYSSVQEGLAKIGGFGTIFVAPGTPCEISGVVFAGPVVISTDRYGYGARAKLVTAESCALVSPAAPNVAVTLGGIDIDGCLAVMSGGLSLDEVNVAWRGNHSAVTVNHGSLSVKRSTIRAKDIAIYAASAGRVFIEESKLATTSTGPQVVRLSAAVVQMNDVKVKGGAIGVLLDNVSEGLDLNKVDVYRGEPGDPYPPVSPGDQGIVVGGAQAMQDLPWLPGMDARRVTIHSGSVTGYNVGIAIGPGSSVAVEDMAVNGAAQGISVAAGSYAQMTNNRIKGTLANGIVLQVGARGTADRNEVQCVHGRCVCYGGDCSSRSNYVFGNGAFRMTDTECDD